MGPFRSMQIAISVFLLGATAFLYAYQPDWWIYGLATGVSALLNLISAPGCPWWRFMSSIVIVLGLLEALFLVWVLRGVEQAPFFDGQQKNEIKEGRYILLVTTAVSLMISTRLRWAEHNGLLDCVRTLILLVFFALSGLLGVYALGFYVPQLSGVVTHYLEQYHI